MIKRMTCLPLLFVLLRFSTAQIVVEEVDFDYYQDIDNNDFVNNFNGGYGMIQIEAEGITGGSVTVPDSSGWGNDNAIYCSRYKPVTGDTVITAISFKYDSALIHPNSFQRAVSIFLRPQADFNHYIIASVSWNKKIELLTYSWNNNPYPPLTLHSNHWYRFELMVIFSTIQQIKISATVSDLGVSGSATPVIVNSSSGTFNDEVLAVDTSIQVSLTAARYGGSTHLDNFYFKGRPGLTDCVNIPTSTAPVSANREWSVYPLPASSYIIIERINPGAEVVEATMFNVHGNSVMHFNMEEERKVLDIMSLKPGMYYLRLHSGRYSNAWPVMVIHE